VQFFSTEQIDELFEIAVKMDIPTICYGLRTDFQMNGFEGSTRLLLIAHSLEELKTICTCGKKAILNGRKVNGKFVFKGQQIAIDKENDVEYQSLCPKCYFDYKREYQQEEEKELV
jgi:thymidine kinase